MDTQDEGKTQARTGTNVYRGGPDARQMADVKHPVSRFRPTYRALSEGEKDLHDEIKHVAMQMEALYAKILPLAVPGRGRYLALALTSLEESVMWAVKELTA